MQQTNKYHFKLIDTSDDFSPNALNDNARAVETELTRVEAETAARDAAVKAGLEAALAEQKSQLEAADKTLAQTVAAVEKGAYFYKLGETAAEADNQAVTFSLSGIRVADYAALLLITGGTGDTVSVRLSVNGVSLGDIAYASGSGYGHTSHAACVAALIPAGKWVALSGFYGGSYYYPYAGRVEQAHAAVGNAAELDWASLTRLEVAGLYPAGMNITLYGIKK